MPDIERIVDDTLEALPQWVLNEIENLAVVVEEWPSPEQDPSGDGLLGLYEGVSLEERGVDYFGHTPDRITVFRGPHVQMGLNRAGTAAEIRRTVLRELGHHLGIDDQRLHELGWD
jgi:predicted Zn-dependent protease with MMP-like domain